MSQAAFNEIAPKMVVVFARVVGTVTVPGEPLFDQDTPLHVYVEGRLIKEDALFAIPVHRLKQGLLE